MDIRIRPALESEFEAVGDLTAEVFIDDGHTLRGGSYEPRLRDARDRAEHAELLVAVDPGTGALLGTVTFAAPGSPYADLAVGRTGGESEAIPTGVAAGRREGEFRMLAVSAAARGRGVGEALVRACLERARELGLPAVVMSTMPAMVHAHRLYERIGFVRTPERDWAPLPHLPLMTYRITLSPVE